MITLIKILLCLLTFFLTRFSRCRSGIRATKISTVKPSVGQASPSAKPDNIEKKRYLN